MNALINEAEERNLNFNNVVALIKQKIEEAIINDKPIVVSASNSCLACRNTIEIAEYEFDEKRFYVSSDNFEIHINMDEVKEVKYDNTYDECFTFLHNDNTEIVVCFL